MKELDAALKLRANDQEATELKNRVTASRVTGPGLRAAVETGGFEPLVRIRRTYSEASFRQAAFQLDQMRAMRLSTLPAAEQAAEYTQQGRDYLAQGLVSGGGAGVPGGDWRGCGVGGRSCRSGAGARAEREWGGMRARRRRSRSS